MSRYVVIGGAGFIGSHLVDTLVSLGHDVTIYDNFSSGRHEWVDSRARIVAHDVIGRAPNLDPRADVVIHLAANPDAREALECPAIDLYAGTIATFNVLEACRVAGIRRFMLASSGTVYGDTGECCAEIDLGRLPISLYGASKLAGEAMASAYAECFGLQVSICRFGNVVGPRATHGCIVDFFRKMLATPGRLDVAGNGHQAKPYLHVSDCVAAMLHVLDHGESNPAIYNVAPSGVTTVRQIAEWCAQRRPGTSIEYADTSKGWPGDVPIPRLNPTKLSMLGFRVSQSSDDAALRAVGEIAKEILG